MVELRAVLDRLTPERLEEVWRHTWGVGGPHNRGPVNRQLLAELSETLRATPAGTDPVIPRDEPYTSLSFTGHSGTATSERAGRYAP